MIMSPTRPMTLPILDFYWHVNVICFFHLTALQIFTCSGSSDVTRAHCVRKSRAFSPPPLYCMASFVVMDDHRQVSTSESLLTLFT